MAYRLSESAIRIILLVMLSARASSLSNPESPESFHRRSWLPFPRERFMQRMLLEATLKYHLPATHACSSLEGSSCLYGSRVQPASSGDTLAEEAGEAVAQAAQRKVKLVMIKPRDGADMKLAVKQYLKKLQGQSGTRDGEEETSSTSAEDISEQDGHVIFEGSSEGLTDIEGIAQRMVKMMGLPESTAGALENRLARAITDMEFSKHQQQDQPDKTMLPANSVGSASTNLDDGSEGVAEEQPANDGEQEVTGRSRHMVAHDPEVIPGVMTAEALAAMTPQQLASSFRHFQEALRILQEGIEPLQTDRQTAPRKPPLPPPPQQQQQQQQYQDQQHLSDHDSQQPDPDVTLSGQSGEPAEHMSQDRPVADEAEQDIILDQERHLNEVQARS